jgi:hypothetical protein
MSLMKMLEPPTRLYRFGRFLTRVVPIEPSVFAILEADERNISTATLIALRRVLAVRQRA